VEVLAEAETSELDRFLGSIQAELGGFIRDTHSEPEPVGVPALDGFHVRF
jgi:hypothetical protein